ncbi:uncharacterized protein [Physcomitrium patens]|uniref:uncharacterized protein isoform X1 n=1 Tax=Physcomitrium patens TaxID=3218 RepID=UPI003CCDBF7E
MHSREEHAPPVWRVLSVMLARTFYRGFASLVVFLLPTFNEVNRWNLQRLFLCTSYCKTCILELELCNGRATLRDNIHKTVGSISKSQSYPEPQCSPSIAGSRITRPEPKT